jgi:hypothetical protein
MADNDDKTVKELIDASTRAELEKWFGLPSFQQAAEQAEAAAAQPQSWSQQELAARRARIDAAVAAVDPRMLEAHRRRVEQLNKLKLFTPNIDTHVDPSILVFDQGMVDKAHTIADPREYELPGDLPDDLHECTPQALLRDLHRPELNFEKQFEIDDAAAEGRVDRHAIIAEALAFRRASLRKPESRLREARALILEMRKDRRRPVSEVTAQLRNRRVKE